MNSIELLTPVDNVLSLTLSAEAKGQFVGQVQQIYDPQARRAALMRYDEQGKPARFTLDTVNFEVQVAHRITGGQPVKNETRYGSRQPVAFHLDWTLMVATKRPDLLTAFLFAFPQLQGVEVISFSTDSLAVLKNEFLFVPEPNKPYDPLLTCFSVKYRMLNVSESVFASLPHSL